MNERKKQFFRNNDEAMKQINNEHNEGKHKQNGYRNILQKI